MTEKSVDLANDISQLAVWRKEYAEVHKKMKEKEMILIEDPEYMKLSKQLDELSFAMDEITKMLRDRAIEIYLLTKEKNPHPAVTIKQFKELFYSDEDALTYCHQYLPGAVKLDRRAFGKVARTANLSFVKICKEPRAQIKRNLDEFIGPGEYLTPAEWLEKSGDE